jgi:hypothetical protein
MKPASLAAIVQGWRRPYASRPRAKVQVGEPDEVSGTHTIAIVSTWRLMSRNVPHCPGDLGYPEPARLGCVRDLDDVADRHQGDALGA